jgi:hypothetical protein
MYQIPLNKKMILLIMMLLLGTFASMACNFCYNDDVLEWFVYVTINVAIVSFME